MGGLVHESIGFVFFVLSTIGATSAPEAIAFRFEPRSPAAPNDLWPRPPRGMALAGDENWWYWKSARPRPYVQKTQENALLLLILLLPLLLLVFV